MRIKISIVDTLAVVLDGENLDVPLSRGTRWLEVDPGFGPSKAQLRRGRQLWVTSAGE